MSDDKISFHAKNEILFPESKNPPKTPIQGVS